MTRRPPGSSSDGADRAATRGADAEDVEEVPVTSEPSSLWPSIHWSMSGPIANASENTPSRGRARGFMRACEALGRRVGRSLTFDREQFVRIAHLVHAKHECVEEREDDRHEAEAKSHRRHDGQGHDRRAAERAPGVQDVSHQAVDNAVPRASRHSSAVTVVEPKRALARVRASAGLSPLAMCFCVSRSM